MRVIDAFDKPVRALAVSPDGRLLAAAAPMEFAVWDWVSGTELIRQRLPSPAGQLAFAPDGSWVACVPRSGSFGTVAIPASAQTHAFPGLWSGGVAVSPDGKTLVATRTGRLRHAKAELWELPGLRPKTGFEDWSPFAKLTYSPNGEFIAGIGTNLFELRVAVTGGFNGRHRVNYVGDGFFSFSRDSQTVVFGWETDLHVMDTRNGNVVRRVTQPENRALLDAVFTSSRHFMTVDGTPELRVWSADSWAIVREYDWGCGGLTCATVSPDGLAGVCGTRTGKVVVFDVDE
ncbi:wd-40 repeat-containing protein : WD-40 repeat protein OS=Cyanothece sp. (strain PCC 7424) GN=PCC7424_1167 PE=4 SV=1 [Gemmataceae bacterium]|nr:wd-40 repeat-containing protein : WD-40 repeat protein OS=Cyanothece sp. (strain PCC 7424) GN=PCC7424_1167 PE=4 SV=1 [Gemmataceae bacterium]VTU01583.1 wd-40 repeat-containing protein : WD-40 repeat protein OS=Cyanothece sp. (strain PCC 7424) GN=PCC7424_1167 PE=4 SV=1 [Gemmataceae bacterium]